MNLSFSTYSVDLPNPTLEDTLRFTAQGIKRITPGGNLKVFKDPDWPVLETFIYDIYRLTQAQLDDFIELVNAAIGQEITITDYLGVVRTGFITTSVNEILTLKDDCWYDIHFEVLVNIIIDVVGDCHDDFSTEISSHLTLDNDSYYRIFAEDGSLMYSESDLDLWIESY